MDFFGVKMIQSILVLYSTFTLLDVTSLAAPTDVTATSSRIQNIDCKLLNSSSILIQKAPYLKSCTNVTVENIKPFSKSNSDEYLCITYYDSLNHICEKHNESFDKYIELIKNKHFENELQSVCNTLQNVTAYNSKTSKIVNTVKLAGSTDCESLCKIMLSTEVNPLCSQIAYMKIIIEKLDNGLNQNNPHIEEKIMNPQPESVPKTIEFNDNLSENKQAGSAVNIQLETGKANIIQSEGTTLPQQTILKTDKNQEVVNSLIPQPVNANAVPSIKHEPTVEKFTEPQKSIATQVATNKPQNEKKPQVPAQQKPSVVEKPDIIAPADTDLSIEKDPSFTGGPEVEVEDGEDTEGFENEDSQALQGKQETPPVQKSQGKPTDTFEDSQNNQFYQSSSVDDENSYFFSYFLFFTIVFVVGYVGYHNKQKILALVLEGRRGRPARRRPNTASYRKLDSNLEEAVTSSCSANSTHVIY